MKKDNGLIWGSPGDGGGPNECNGTSYRNHSAWLHFVGGSGGSVLEGRGGEYHQVNIDGRVMRGVVGLW